MLIGMFKVGIRQERNIDMVRVDGMAVLRGDQVEVRIVSLQSLEDLGQHMDILESPIGSQHQEVRPAPGNDFPQRLVLNLGLHSCLPGRGITDMYVLVSQLREVILQSVARVFRHRESNGVGSRVQGHDMMVDSLLLAVEASADRVHHPLGPSPSGLSRPVVNNQFYVIVLPLHIPDVVNTHDHLAAYSVERILLVELGDGQEERVDAVPGNMLADGCRGQVK